MLTFIVIVIVLVVFLLIAIIAILYKAANLQLQRAETYEDWILEFKEDIQKTYTEIKNLDDRQIFEKDDEVGVIFQEMAELLKKINERTQNEGE